MRAIRPPFGNGHRELLRGLGGDGNAVGIVVEPLLAIEAVQRDPSPFDSNIGARTFLRDHPHYHHGRAQNFANVSEVDGFRKSRDVLGLHGERREVPRAIAGNDEE